MEMQPDCAKQRLRLVDSDYAKHGFDNINLAARPKNEAPRPGIERGDISACNLSYFAPRTASFAAFATRNFTTVLAGI